MRSTLTMASSSPLLNLPPELRNIIIEHALTSSTRALQFNASSKQKPIFEDAPTHEFNQLKYVCKQLYTETAGLEIKYNALRFELPEDDAYALARIQNYIDSGFDKDLFAHIRTTSFPPFLYTCAPSRLPWLREVIITIRKPARYSLSQPTVDRLLSLTRFARDNPWVKITYEYVDEVYGYKAPKYQQVVPWLSVAVCLGAVLPIPAAWSPVGNILLDACGRGNLLFWSIGLGIWELVGMK